MLRDVLKAVQDVLPVQNPLEGVAQVLLADLHHWWIWTGIVVAAAAVECLYGRLALCAFARHWSAAALLRLGRTAAHGIILFLLHALFTPFWIALLAWLLAALIAKYIVNGCLLRPAPVPEFSAPERRWLDRLCGGAKGGPLRSAAVLVACVGVISGAGMILLQPWTYVTLALKWQHQAQFAGFYVAEADGLYAARRLRVRIVAGGPEDAKNPFLRVGSLPPTTLAIGIGDPIELIRRNSFAADNYTAVAAVYQSSPSTWFVRAGSGIRSVDDLRGKSIGASKGVSNVDRELEYWLAINGLGRMVSIDAMEWFTMNDVQRRARVRDRVAAVRIREPALDSLLHFMAGSVDVWSGYATNELQSAREAFGPENITDIRDGIGAKDLPSYGDIIFVRAADTKDGRHRDGVQRFLCASIEGWRAALSQGVGETPRVLNIVARYLAPPGPHNGHSQRQHQREMLDSSRRYAGDLDAFGRIEEAKWAELAGIVREYSKIVDPSIFDGRSLVAAPTAADYDLSFLQGCRTGD